MDDEMTSFLASVDEFVDDEDRVVTSKWLCQQLTVPLQQSQRILQNYINSCEKQDKALLVVHTLTGHFEGGLVISIVKDDELEKSKSKLDKVLSTSLYSIQKSKVNTEAIYAAEYQDCQEHWEELLKHGGIEYKATKKMSKEEIRAQRMSSYVNQDVSSSDIEKQFARPPKSSKTNFFGKSDTASKPVIPSESKNFSRKTPKQGVASFLTKEKTDPFAQNRPKLKSAEGEKRQNGDKQDGIQKTAEPEPTPKTSGGADLQVNGHKSKLSQDGDIDDTSGDFFKIKETKPKEKKSKVTKQENPPKKRKRIEYFSSSSDSDEVEEEVVDIIPPSPPRKKLPAFSEESNKRMKKVLRKRTFMDEDGSMVTEKFYEFEECDVATDNADSETLKESSPKKKQFPTVSTAAPKKQKQASIMGFFKKK